MNKLAPLVVAVAPNGARRTKQDHPALPMNSGELAETAFACMEAGAAMIHMHVRDADGRHSLDVGRYRDATAAIRERCGDGMIIQATTEAVGLYTPSQQMAMIRELVPESASFAIAELVPEGGEGEAREFFREVRNKNILPHYILYSDSDVRRFLDLMDRDIIPQSPAFLLFVLGRYTSGQVSHPRDILPFLNALSRPLPWSICAFGPLEHAAASAAVALGGHVRVGFENNLLLQDGQIAADNAALVRQIAAVGHAIGRSLATAREVRAIVQERGVADYY